MTDQQTRRIEAAARAIRDTTVCGYTYNNERIFCDDARMPADKIDVCLCKKAAKAALAAADAVDVETPLPDTNVGQPDPYVLGMLDRLLHTGRYRTEFEWRHGSLPAKLEKERAAYIARFGKGE